MRSWVRSVIVVAVAWGLGMWYAPWAAGAKSKKAVKPANTPAGQNLLTTERLWAVELRISQRGWQMMQPLRAPRIQVLLDVSRDDLPTTRPVSRPEDGEGRRMAPSPHGYEYAYTRATVEIDGRKLDDVGVRFKGNYSYTASASGLRRPLKLDFNRFVEKQKFDGLTAVNLHNNTGDPSQIRDALSYVVFREARVPAPRTSFAAVYLTIDGQFERQYVGLYTVVEEVDSPFLKEHFGSSTGLLLKPEGMRYLPYLGEDWADYIRYRPKSSGDAKLQQRFIEFLRLINFAEDAKFKEQIASYLAVDDFLRFVAVNALLTNMDSFLNGSHNYYIYVHPEDEHIYFIPWDMHLSFGGSGPGLERSANLNFRRPYYSPNHLIDRVLAIEEYREAYEGYVLEFARTCFRPERMNARIEAMQRLVQRAESDPPLLSGMARSTTRPAALPPRNLRNMPDLKPFVDARVESVLAQLGGLASGEPGNAAPAPFKVLRPPAVAPKPVAPAPARREGVFERIGRGERGRDRRAPASRQKAGPNPWASVALRAIDADRDASLKAAEVMDAVPVFFHVADRQGRGVIDEAAIAQALGFLGKLLDVVPAPFPPELSAPAVADGSDPTPSQVWAKAIMQQADADDDGLLTLAEALDAARKWFDEADQRRDQVLIQSELGDFLDRIAPR